MVGAGGTAREAQGKAPENRRRNGPELHGKVVYSYRQCSPGTASHAIKGVRSRTCRVSSALFLRFVHGSSLRSQSDPLSARGGNAQERQRLPPFSLRRGPSSVERGGSEGRRCQSTVPDILRSMYVMFRRPSIGPISNPQSVVCIVVAWSSAICNPIVAGLSAPSWLHPEFYPQGIRTPKTREGSRDSSYKVIASNVFVRPH